MFYPSRLNAQLAADNSMGDQSFEFSLMSLKESVARLTERSRWLSVEIKRLHSQTAPLQEEFALLTSEGRKWSVVDSHQSSPTSFFPDEYIMMEKGIHRLRSDLERLQGEEMSMQGQLAIKSKTREEMAIKIQEVQKDIDSIARRLTLIQEKLEGSNNHSNDDKFQEKIHLAHKRIMRKDEVFRGLQKRYFKPSMVIEGLESELKTVEQSSGALKNEASMLEQEKERLLQEISALDSDKQGKLVQMKNEIQELSKEEGELNQILIAARNKLSDKNIGMLDDMETKRLQDNLSVIKAENASLAEEMSSLEQVLEPLAGEKKE